jgi:hypothetical protein
MKYEQENCVTFVLLKVEKQVKILWYDTCNSYFEVSFHK